MKWSQYFVRDTLVRPTQDQQDQLGVSRVVIGQEEVPATYS